MKKVRQEYEAEILNILFYKLVENEKWWKTIWLKKSKDRTRENNKNNKEKKSLHKKSDFQKEFFFDRFRNHPWKDYIEGGRLQRPPKYHIEKRESVKNESFVTGTTKTISTRLVAGVQSAIVENLPVQESENL